MKRRVFIQLLLLFTFLSAMRAQNPIIRDQFTADPTARVFNGEVYLYPSHDIFATEGKGRPGWFCMEDYHVFSSGNLTDWTDHGVIVSQNNVDWVDSTSYSMWAPDCVERSGKYYFYFPANTNIVGNNGRRGFGIGVAIAERPEGPFIPQPEPIKGVLGIDPNVLIDKDGQAYLYWSMGNIYVAKLKDNMLELDSEPMIIPNLPDRGLKEGPFVFERNGIYYLTFPHVENRIERLEYAIGDNPLGPFKMTGVIMDESPMNCWTNHHSVVNYKDQWYLFYHQNALSPDFDKNRAVCVDSLFFNADGTIQKVVPTLRGVGVTNAMDKIQIDRYSKKSSSGITVDFLNSENTFGGWKCVFDSVNSWVQYNAVEFDDPTPKSVRIRVKAEADAQIEIRLNNSDGPILVKTKISGTNDWNIVETKIKRYKKGIYNLVVLSKGKKPLEVDWVQFIQ